ncbi:MAG TPA: hypothetical protein VFR07_03870 [Mycobacteriales bacterium]|nr:hypothetical protein [Mycobacteriales bacterium]
MTAAPPPCSDDLAGWLRALLEERAGPAREILSSYRGIDAAQQVQAGAGDLFREALISVADTEARARLIELHRGGHACRVEDVVLDGPEWTRRSVRWSARPCLTLRLLAAPFWGWPGWRPEWAL